MLTVTNRPENAELTFVVLRFMCNQAIHSYMIILRGKLVGQDQTECFCLFVY